MQSALLFSVFLLGVLSPLAFSYIETYPAVESNATSTVPLFFAFIISFGGAFNSSHSIPGVQLALDHINQDPTMLPGYTLHYTLTDSQCNHTVALKGFVQQIVPGPTKLAVLGAGCSVATEAVADISQLYNITQISGTSSSAELSNRLRFKNYFQLLPAEDRLFPAFIGLSRQYNWKRFTIIKQNENIFSRLVDRMLESFSQMNISWNLQQFESSRGVLSLPDAVLFNSGNRITFLSMYSNHARQYICEAYKRGFRYPQYVYIMYGWYRNQWWYPVSGENVTCNNSQMEQVLERSLTVTQYPQIMNRSEVTDTGEDYNTFRMELDEKAETTGFEYFGLSEHCYDSVWALARALNRTISDLDTNPTLNLMAASAEQLNNTKFKIEHFTYQNNIVKAIMFGHLEKTNFTGITGSVTFDNSGIRAVNRLRISQYQRNNDAAPLNRVEIASVSGGGEEFQYITGTNSSLVWPEFIPYDGVANNVTVSVSIAVTVPYTLLTILGIVFAVVCLSFNIIFRNTKLIRLSSSSLNYVIIIGAAVMYLSIVLYIVPVTEQLAATLLCNLGPRLLSLGYCLCFGTILAKMFRVYHIFTNPSPTRKAIKDWHLGLFVMALVLIDIVLLGVTAAFPYARDLATLEPNAEYLYEETGVLRYRTDFFVFACNQNANYVNVGVIFGYMALLQIAAIFLAFGTRKVKVKGLNDSLYIAVTIYVTSILLVIIIGALLFLNNRVNTYAATLSTSIFISATVILSLVFVPKMVWLYKDPKGEAIFNSTNSGQQQQQTIQMAQLTNNTHTSTVDTILSDQNTSDKEKINILANRVKELESMVNGKRSSKSTQGTVSSVGRPSVDWNSTQDEIKI